MKPKKIYLVSIIICILIISGLIFAQRNDDQYSSETDTTSKSNAKHSIDISKYEESLTETEMKNGIDELKKEEKRNYDEIIAYYEMLIEFYPNKENYIDYGKFLAVHSKFDKADEMWRKSIDESYKDYKLIEDLYISYQMYERLLNFYLQVYDGEKHNNLRLSRKIITMYEVLNRQKEKADFRIKLLKEGSDSIFLSHSAYVVKEFRKEVSDTSYLLKKLEELVNDDTFSEHRKFQLKEDLAEIYIYLNQIDKAYNTYYSIVIHYEQSFKNDEKPFFVIEKTLNKAINNFLFIEQYQEAIVFISKYLNLLEKRSPEDYTELSIELSRIYLNINKPDEALENLQRGLNYINTLTKDKDEKSPNYSLQSLTLKRYEMYYDIGYIYFEQREFSKAIEYLSKIEYADRYNNYYFLLGKCYLALGHINKAKKYFDESSMKFSNYENYSTVYYLALIALFENKIITALNAYEEILQSSKISESEYAIKTLNKYNILLDIVNNEQRLQRFIEFEKLIHNFKLEKNLLSNPVKTNLNQLYINSKLFDYIENMFDLDKKNDAPENSNGIITNNDKKTVNHNFDYKNLYSEKDYVFTYDEDFYMYFEIVEILLNSDKIEEAMLLLFRDMDKFEKTKNRINGFYYQKAVYLLCKNYIDYYFTESYQIDGNNTKNVNPVKFEYVKDLLLNLLIEFPDTIYLNKIKKLVEKIE